MNGVRRKIVHDHEIFMHTKEKEWAIALLGRVTNGRKTNQCH